MCFSKLFKKKEEVYPEYTGKTALTFAINDYPGGASDLRGCINDQENIHEVLFKQHYPDFTVLKYKNRDVKTWRMRRIITHYVELLQPGDFLFIHYSGHGTQGVDPNHTEADGYSEALYLHDGPLWDYEISNILSHIPEGAKVVVAFDSCFSGGSAHRLKNSKKMRCRYAPIQDIKPEVPMRKRILREHKPRFILFAGCQECQTSADAKIDGQYVGAFTYFWLKAFLEGISYDRWNTRTKYAIEQFPEFDQIPMLIGEQELISQIVFT